MISPSTELNFAHLFRQGYRKGAETQRALLRPELIATCEVNEAGGYDATRELMARGGAPSAIIYNNDVMALGGCRALGDLGVKPGRDVALIVAVASPFAAICHRR